MVCYCLVFIVCWCLLYVRLLALGLAGCWFSCLVVDWLLVC